MKDLYDFRKDNENNAFFTAPYGFGKSTQLKLFTKKALESNNTVIPIYLSLDDPKVINNGIFNFILLEYCGDSSSNNSEQILRLKKVLKNNDERYKYVFLIDDYETLINNGIYENTVNEIKELSKLSDNIKIIISSTYFDEYNFPNFNHIELLPLGHEKIIEYIKKTIGIFVDVINNSLLNELRAPLLLKNFVDYIKENDIKKTTVKSITNCFDLFRTKLELSSRGYSKIILKLLPELANYCSENNTNIVPYSFLAKEYSKSRNIPLFERLRFAYKRRYRENKDDLFNYLNIFSENLHIGSIIKHEDAFGFKFSRQFYVDYFTAYYCYHCSKEGNFKPFGYFLFSEQMLLALSAFMNKEADRPEDKIVDIQTKRKNRNEKIDSSTEKKEAFLIANIVNWIYTYKESFAGIDLSNLDLRFCNFIGKNCKDTKFSDSVLSNECFIAIEPENSNIFAMSPDGKYYITGDENCLNLRNAEFPISIRNFSCEDDNQYKDCWFIENNSFCVKTKNEVLNFEINNYDVQLNEDFDELDSIQCRNGEMQDDKLSYAGLFGKVRCFNDNYALIESGSNSYYGQAYLLFDLKSNDLISVHEINRIITPYKIVQKGDEIEFLYDNNGDGILRSVCYNEKSGDIFKKKYPLLLNRAIIRSNGKILFDTNDINSHMQWVFEHFPTYRMTDKIYDEYKDDLIKISQMTPSFHRMEREHVYIVTPKESNYLKYEDDDYIDYYIFEYNRLRTGFNKFNCTAITSSNAFLIALSKEISFWVEDKKRYYNSSFSSFEKKYMFLIGRNFNIVDISKNEFKLMINNDIYTVKFNEESDDFTTYFEEQLPLEFEPMYEKAIEEFSWRSTIEEVLSEKSDDVEKLCKKYVRKNIKDILEKYKDAYNRSWSFVFSSFIEDWYVRLEKAPLPENDDFINAFKNWCFPCDKGVTYFNGSHTCFLYKNDMGKICEIKFAKGAQLLYFRDGVHINTIDRSDFIGYYYEMYDINKTAGENSDAPKIRFNDLWLYKAEFDNVKGLSKKVKDFLVEESKKKVKYYNPRQAESE